MELIGWIQTKTFFHQINPQKSLSAANPTFEKECPGIYHPESAMIMPEKVSQRMSEFGSLWV